MVQFVRWGEPLRMGLNLTWYYGPRMVFRLLKYQLYFEWPYQYGGRPALSLHRVYAEHMPWPRGE